MKWWHFVIYPVTFAIGWQIAEAFKSDPKTISPTTERDKVSVQLDAIRAAGGRRRE